MSVKISPRQFTRVAYEAEKTRLKALGHVIDETEFDYFFSAANGDTTRISSVYNAMQRSPNPRAKALQRFTDSLGENFAAAVDEFSAIV